MSINQLTRQKIFEKINKGKSRKANYIRQTFLIGEIPIGYG